MNEEELDDKEQEINDTYQQFLEDVRVAFDRHCDEIKAQAEKKLEETPEDNESAREEIRKWEEDELDKTLAELQELLNRREMMVRQQLEEIEVQREQGRFDFENELAQTQELKADKVA